MQNTHFYHIVYTGKHLEKLFEIYIFLK